ncbi:sensor histidine kinase [Polymorphobacter fuscus]|uniref:sensor histidine kinase n=1 Tax=Sandarakinorhabdus fusca TaxID=1439888 RepID=UPI0014301024|nr:sensor histidine kinase [Polymorphobacter fuscus]NJC09542.1 two-component sensor histidine kinase [Polymorphobacter fuscus]
MTTNRQLSKTLGGALILALLPMGLLAVLLSLRSYNAVIAVQGAVSPLGLFGIVLPVLIWITALVVGWYAVSRLVVQPLLAIERGMALYGRSSDPARTRLRFGARDFGSAELASLAASFDSMADEIDQHSRNLRSALVEQQRLTREVHHRVKNNLQIVSSLLSLQARGADSSESAQTYAVIQARLAALMHVHRWMYDDATSHGVDLTSLAGELCAGLETSLVSPAHPKVTMVCETAPIILHPDAAVPVAFLITELASLAASYAEPGPLEICVSATLLPRNGDDPVKSKIAVESAGFKGVDHIAAASMTPTARIIHGMARQLRSALVHDADIGCYSVTFAGSA